MDSPSVVFVDTLPEDQVDEAGKVLRGRLLGVQQGFRLADDDDDDDEDDDDAEAMSLGKSGWRTEGLSSLKSGEMQPPPPPVVKNVLDPRTTPIARRRVPGAAGEDDVKSTVSFLFFSLSIRNGFLI